MILEEPRGYVGEHNSAHLHAMTIPIPSECLGKGTVCLSWSTHPDRDGNPIHSFYWKDEKGQLLAAYTASHDEVIGWRVHVGLKDRLKRLSRAAKEVFDHFSG